MKLAAIALGAIVLALGAFEGYRAYSFYSDLSAAKSSLLSIKEDLDLGSLQDSEPDVLQKRERIIEAGERLRSARGFVETDPFLWLVGNLPVLGKQAKGLKTLVLAADESARTGERAADVALAFARYERDPNKTSIQAALDFLKRQEQPMADVGAGLQRLHAHRDELPDGLWGPLARARDDLDNALAKLGGLNDGYVRANGLLPDVLGYGTTRRYLLLPQNSTELFPSGGLISSYGIITFKDGVLTDIEIEYFGDLFDRWQRRTNGEYVEPPRPLKNYLKRHFSWGLGEAGWYPDFPTTADLAKGFVAKGGAPETEGTIAVDLKFLIALLGIVGPVNLPGYGVTVTPQNIEELSLELTRDEDYTSGQTHQAFLSQLARAVLSQIFVAPKDKWVDLLRVLDQMAQERHLQLHFLDPRLQSLTAEYGFDGGLIQPDASNFLLIADTSVNSTKLNLILKPRARLEVQLLPEGRSRSLVTYEIENPFPEWKVGRDPNLVSTLMLGGVYGSYTRLYLPERATFVDVRLNGQRSALEQLDRELGKTVFGRFFTVLPGAKSNVQFLYDTPASAEKAGDGLNRYRLYVQKQAGTTALPFDFRVNLPPGARLISITLDGKDVKGDSLVTDLRVDRQIEVTYKTP